MKLYLTVATRNLLQARRRTALLSGAIAVVTALLVLLLSLSAGIRETLVFASTAVSTGHVNVNGFYKAAPGDAAPLVTEAAEVRRVVEAEIDGIEHVIDRVNGFGKLISPTGSLTTVFKGIDVEQEKHFFEAIELAPESEYVDGGSDSVLGDASRLAEPATALIFVGHAKMLGVTVGDQLTIKSETLRGQSNTADVTVVAVARDIGLMSSWHAFTDMGSMRSLYQLNDDTTGSIMLYLDDIERADEVAEELRTVLLDNGYEVMDYDPRAYWMKFERVMAEDWTGQRLDITTWEDEMSWITWMITAVEVISVILVIILTVIIVIGIMNAMWISVRERTSEVGTLRAIGMGRWQILGMFLTEALLLGLVATIVGALAGGGVALAIDAAEIKVPIDAMQIVLMSDTINLDVHLTQVAIAVFAFTLITMLAASWPAIRAARLQPVTAIHHTE